MVKQVIGIPAKSLYHNYDIINKKGYPLQLISPYLGLFQGILNNGQVASYGKVYIYNYSTGELVDSYTSALRNVKNTKPIILSASGKAEIFLPIGITYEVTLKDQYDETVWTEIITPNCINGECYNFRVSDGIGGHIDYIVLDGEFMVGNVHGGCGNPCAPTPDITYGYVCDDEPDEICPDCVGFNVLNERKSYHVVFDPYGEEDIYFISKTHGSCTD